MAAAHRRCAGPCGPCRLREPRGEVGLVVVVPPSPPPPEKKGSQWTGPVQAGFTSVYGHCWPRLPVSPSYTWPPFASPLAHDTANSRCFIHFLAVPNCQPISAHLALRFWGGGGGFGTRPRHQIGGGGDGRHGPKRLPFLIQWQGQSGLGVLRAAREKTLTCINFRQRVCLVKRQAHNPAHGFVLRSGRISRSISGRDVSHGPIS